MVVMFFCGLFLGIIIGVVFAPFIIKQKFPDIPGMITETEKRKATFPCNKDQDSWDNA